MRNVQWRETNRCRRMNDAAHGGQQRGFGHGRQDRQQDWQHGEIRRHRRHGRVAAIRQLTAEFGPLAAGLVAGLGGVVIAVRAVGHHHAGRTVIGGQHTGRRHGKKPQANEGNGKFPRQRL